MADMRLQAGLEQAKSPSVDAAAEPTARRLPIWRRRRRGTNAKNASSTGSATAWAGGSISSMPRTTWKRICKTEATMPLRSPPADCRGCRCPWGRPGDTPRVRSTRPSRSVRRPTIYWISAGLTVYCATCWSSGCLTCRNRRSLAIRSRNPANAESERTRTMTDPYQVLGVQPSATDEEVKAAYRGAGQEIPSRPLQRQPALRSRAGKDAGDQRGVRRHYPDAPAGRSGTAGQGPFPGGGTSCFMDIRNLIRTGRVMDAETLLDGIPGPSRTGNGISSRGVSCSKKDGSTTPTTIFPLRSGWIRATWNTGRPSTRWRCGGRTADTGPAVRRRRLQRLRHVQRPDLRGLLL